MAKLLLLNGPNLNLLGSREPDVYGRADLAEIESQLTIQAERLGHGMHCLQSNAEHVLVDRVQQARDDGIEFILLNPGALTHTSVSLRDALLAVAVPFIEIHISNVFAREEFRQHSFFSDIAAGCIFGLGAQGYELALQAAHRQLARAEGV
ncbi:MAG: type II 3-dehydroquinate dehydratase [Woeseia sp.]|nr:type II 3-dehydroquinate dehydratase [Woeseia sp.]MBT8096722.1 type II 3-dehydroquinate dehydratase [Woeseia sp.]NNE61678.1 type II 3-dehydroquinate dehydratase [Woeseia sp.]NNL54112.1 type II 3-dehydroquinate dehydratase [Woeseia sp.]